MTDTVSVVLPTRNRCAETLSTIATVLASTHDDLILHVFDNNSTDGTRDAVLALEDERIDYQRSDTDLSVTDSFEAAYRLARAEWVTGLGADDGMSCFAIEAMLTAAAANGVLAVSTEHASYHWPGMTTEASGRLHLRRVGGDEVLSTEETIRRVLRNKAKFQDLPTAYKSGIVHRSILQSIRSRHGRLFDSWNPDVFLGFAVARQTPVYVRSGRPLTISGTSSQSTGWNTLGDGTNRGQMEEFFSLSAGSVVTLHPRFAAVAENMPKHMVLMHLEAYMKATPDPVGRERLLAAPLFQLAVLLSDSRKLSPEALRWARSYASASGTGLWQRVRWAAARMFARQRSIIASGRRLRARGREGGSVRLTVDNSDDAVLRARHATGVTITPGPATVEEAAAILSRALAKDADLRRP